MIGIYKITSPSGRVYIGQSWNIKKRFSSYRNLTCSFQRILFNSLKKYGPENHIMDIIHELPEDITQSIMDQYEIFYIQQYKDCEINLMNLREGGSRGKHSEETIRKMKEEPTENSIKRRMFIIEYNNKPDRYRRPKGFYIGKRHPREYKIKQIDSNLNVKIWDSIKEVHNNLGYSKSNLSKAVKNKTKYQKSYWYKIQ